MLRIAILLALCGLASCNGGDSPVATDGAAEIPQPGAAAEERGNVTLTAADDVTVFGTLSTAKEENDRVILLFHQARSNRHEYDPIASELNKLGFDTLAIDQRSGGTMWDQDNETVKEIGESQEYLYALPDLQAAVDWAIQKEYKSIITIGSSYSAALNFILAKANGDKLTAICSFSPGEYLGKPDLVKEAVAEVTIPIYVTAAADKREQGAVDDVLSKYTLDKVVRYAPNEGVHGASMLREDMDPIEFKQNFAELKKFLASNVK